MAWFIGIPVFLLVWTLGSLFCLFATLGNKHGKGHWYDWVLLAPLLLLAEIV